MIESFVDLTYRGLALGRRVKLTQVRPTTGYLEMPAPMPVGTTIAISTDEGVTLEAKVTAIHEQVGGSDRPPGMTVTPALAEPATASWWSARVALPEEDKPIARAKGITVRPRSHTLATPPSAEAATPTDVLTPDRAVRRTGDHAIVDDGKPTTLMDAVDPAALGLVSASGSMLTASAEDDDDGDGDGDGDRSDDKKPAGTVKKRKKKR